MMSENAFEMSVIVIATGPERLVARAIEGATRQTSPSTELVIVHESEEAAARLRLRGCLRERPATFVRPDSTTPGAARNAGVRRSSGRFFLISDGSESLPVDHASNGSDALNAATDADFAAAAGGSLFGAVRAGSPIERRIDAAALVGGPWCVGPAIVRRRAFDDCGGFDEGLPALVDWDFLLTLCQGGRCGVLLADSGSRYVDDDIRLRESTRPECHLPAQRRIFTKHLNTFHRFWRNAILERERTAQALFEYEQTLLIRRRERLAEVDATKREIAALAPAAPAKRPAKHRFRRPAAHITCQPELGKRTRTPDRSALHSPVPDPACGRHSWSGARNAGQQPDGGVRRGAGGSCGCPRHRPR